MSTSTGPNLKINNNTCISIFWHHTFNYSFDNYLRFFRFSLIAVNPSPPLHKNEIVIIRYIFPLSNGSNIGMEHLLQSTSTDWTRCPMGFVTLKVTRRPISFMENEYEKSLLKSVCLRLNYIIRKYDAELKTRTCDQMTQFNRITRHC